MKKTEGIKDYGSDNSGCLISLAASGIVMLLASYLAYSHRDLPDNQYPSGIYNKPPITAPLPEQKKKPKNIKIIDAIIFTDGPVEGYQNFALEPGSQLTLEDVPRLKKGQSLFSSYDSDHRCYKVTEISILYTDRNEKKVFFSGKHGMDNLGNIFDP